MKRKRKKRNHYIPRFLINRFASRIDTKKRKKIYWVWQFTRDNAPIEISTKDAAVGAHFYGKDSTTIEDPFSTYETNFSRTLNTIDADGILTVDITNLRQLFWYQSIRTQAIRAQFKGAVDELLTAMQESARNPDVKTHFIEHAIENIDELLLGDSRDMSPAQRATLRILLDRPETRNRILRFAEKQLRATNLGQFVSGYADQIRGMERFSSFAKSGQLHGLKMLLDKGTVPDVFSPAAWKILEGTPGSVILGDVCVIGLGDQGDVGTLLRFGQNWREAYMPISDRKILVAMAKDAVPKLTITDVNVACASLSFKFLFSSERTPLASELANLIGTRAAVLTKDEVFKIVDDSWRNLGKNSTEPTDNTV